MQAASMPRRRPITVGEVLSRYPGLVLLNNSNYFSFVADALHATFDELGLAHEVATSIPPGSNATFIVFVTHEGLQLPRNYISYNFEQLTTTKPWPSHLFERLRGAHMVWDYSLENIKVLKARGIHNTYHVPLGYAPAMDNSLPPAPHRDVDVVFVGNINAKRSALLQQLAPAAVASQRGAPLRTVFTGSTWGRDQLALYRRSKVALNLHFYDGATILEVHRVLPLLASKVLVLSEPSNDTWLDRQYDGLVNFTAAGPGGGLLQSVSGLLELDVEAEAERRYQQLLSCCQYPAYIVAVLRQVYPKGAAATA